jgi:hypothetical protein
MAGWTDSDDHPTSCIPDPAAVPLQEVQLQEVQLQEVQLREVQRRVR